MSDHSKKEYNILLFGETGAGKSTTINSLANYLLYNTFDDAASGAFVKVIPSKITLLHPETYQPLILQDEADQNECHNDDGNSVTQSPKTYELHYGEKILRIIDTPGMGDTGGLEVDKANFEKILKHLENFKTLHSICFLIKTNTTRKTAVFGYCLNQLLIHLPRSTCKNIVFCFTFSRNSLYGPGDGFTTLRGFLNANELGGEKIDLKSGGNCFFIDNEAFRFLLAKKYGYPFSEDKAQFYRESWDTSVEQMLKMIKQMTQLEPCKVDIIFRLIEIKILLQELAQPYVQLRKSIEASRKSIADEARRNASFHNKQKSLKEQAAKESETRISIWRKLMDEQKADLQAIEREVRQYIPYYVKHSNINCQNIILPFIGIFEKISKSNSTASLKQKNSNSNRNSKKRKGNNSQVTSMPVEETLEQKLKKTFEILKNENVPELKAQDIANTKQNFANLQTLGTYFQKQFQIERQEVISPNLLTTTIPKATPVASTAVKVGATNSATKQSLPSKRSISNSPGTAKKVAMTAKNESTERKPTFNGKGMGIKPNPDSKSPKFPPKRATNVSVLPTKGPEKGKSPAKSEPLPETPKKELIVSVPKNTNDLKSKEISLNSQINASNGNPAPLSPIEKTGKISEQTKTIMIPEPGPEATIETMDASVSAPLIDFSILNTLEFQTLPIVKVPTTQEFSEKLKNPNVCHLLDTQCMSQLNSKQEIKQDHFGTDPVFTPVAPKPEPKPINTINSFLPDRFPNLENPSYTPSLEITSFLPDEKLINQRKPNKTEFNNPNQTTVIFRPPMFPNDKVQVQNEGNLPANLQQNSRKTGLTNNYAVPKPKTQKGPVLKNISNKRNIDLERQEIRTNGSKPVLQSGLGNRNVSNEGNLANNNQRAIYNRPEHTRNPEKCPFCTII